VLSYVEHRPRAELRAFVECLWIVSDARPRRRREPERVVPDGCPELIVHRGDPFAREVGGRWTPQPRVFLAGTLSRPWRLRAGLRVFTLGIRFRPGAVGDVLPVSLAGAADREVRLEPLLSAAVVGRLRRAVARARGHEAVFAAAEAWLVERRAGRPRPRGGKRTTPESARAAVAAFLESGGQARVEDVARGLGLTRRKLERVFARDVGLRPKLFARIVRLNAVLLRFEPEERSRVVDLALDAGYFDEAHLRRDFRALAGRGPLASRDADGEMARHFTHPRRLRALFAGE
jgi:AraC-like DNA-binding protein